MAKENIIIELYKSGLDYDAKATVQELVINSKITYNYEDIYFGPNNPQNSIEEFDTIEKVFEQ